ncbi:MAG: beta-ketoacyl-ACP synthase II [Myxococcaceae bacterium]|nr:beta-ketoacyl-ACP synthase II [Myxococcaceae bacterium]
MGRRVVITGTGLVTALGTGVEKTWSALLAGTSGISRITRFTDPKLTVNFAGEVKDFDAEKFFEKKEARRLDPYCQFALAAADMAMAEAQPPVGLDKPNGYDPEKFGVIVGSGIGGLMAFEESAHVGTTKGWDRLSPFFILKMISNMAPGRISMKYQAKGPNWGPVSACSTSGHAIGEAYLKILSGEIDLAVAGGAEAAVCVTGIAGFEAMRALSTNVANPAGASRPFDKDRDGFVMGEGAGIVVLEEYEAAKKRGAKIIAELIGYAANSDAYHETQPAPEGEGAVRCMKLALKSAKLNPEDVGYINAHGTSTPFNDANETKAIKTVFGAHAKKLMVSSTKSMTGHMLGAAGGAECVISALSLQRGVLPPTINYTTPDPECDLDYVPNAAREVRMNVAMSNSFGFGGTNAVLVLKRAT